jgi:hypothetical protein
VQLRDADQEVLHRYLLVQANKDRTQWVLWPRENRQHCWWSRADPKLKASFEETRDVLDQANELRLKGPAHECV